MKNKAMKKALLISAGMLAAGGICIGIGIAMGGSPAFYLDEDGIHLKETTASTAAVQDYTGQEQTAAFDKIEVNLESGEFSLEEGDSYSVAYILRGDREEPVCQVENGKLVVREGDSRKSQEGKRWYFRLRGEEGERWQDDPYVKITVPKGVRLKEVSVDAPWDIDLAANLSAEKLSVKTSYGEIKMEDWDGTDLSIYDENGDIKTGNLTGDKVEITGLYGELNIGCIESAQASLKAENGSVTVFAGTQGTLDVKNSYGDTTIYGMQNTDAYGYDLHTDYGEIHLPGYAVKENENGDAAEYRKQASGSASIRVSAENGDIKIRENVAKNASEEGSVEESVPEVTISETESADGQN